MHLATEALKHPVQQEVEDVEEKVRIIQVELRL